MRWVLRNEDLQTLFMSRRCNWPPRRLAMREVASFLVLLVSTAGFHQYGQYFSPPTPYTQRLEMLHDTSCPFSSLFLPTGTSTTVIKQTALHLFRCRCGKNNAALRYSFRTRTLSAFVSAVDSTRRISRSSKILHFEKKSGRHRHAVCATPGKLRQHLLATPDTPDSIKDNIPDEKHTANTNKERRTQHCGTCAEHEDHRGNGKQAAAVAALVFELEHGREGDPRVSVNGELHCLLGSSPWQQLFGPNAVVTMTKLNFLVYDNCGNSGIISSGEARLAVGDRLWDICCGTDAKV